MNLQNEFRDKMSLYFGAYFSKLCEMKLYFVLEVGPKKTKFALLSVQAQSVNLSQYQNVFKVPKYYLIVVG